MSRTTAPGEHTTSTPSTAQTQARRTAQPAPSDRARTHGVAASPLGNARVVGTSRGVPASPLADPRVQTKLVVGAPGNRYEREADSIADRIVRATSGSAAGPPADASTPPAQSISRLGPAATSPPRPTHAQRVASVDAGRGSTPEAAGHGRDTNERTVQRDVSATGASSGDVLPPPPDSVGSRAQGRPLGRELRDVFEPHLGVGLGDVRLHHDEGAARMADSIQARAFTLGSDIYFGRGEFAPQSTEGTRLLAHELVHTVQQGGSSEVVQRKEGKPHRAQIPKGIEGDNPGVEPTAQTHANAAVFEPPISLRIDGDGNQHKELLFVFRQRPPGPRADQTTIDVEIIFLPTKQAYSRVITVGTIALAPMLWHDDAPGTPNAPTKIYLGNRLTSPPANGPMLIIDHVDHVATGASTATTYHFAGEGLIGRAPASCTFVVPASAAAKGLRPGEDLLADVFDAGAASAPNNIGRGSSIDLPIGARGDRFRITLIPATVSDAYLSIMPLKSEANPFRDPYSTKPIEFTWSETGARTFMLKFTGTPFRSEADATSLLKRPLSVVSQSDDGAPAKPAEANSAIVRSDRNRLLIDVTGDGRSVIELHDRMHATGTEADSRTTWTHVFGCVPVSAGVSIGANKELAFEFVRERRTMNSFVDRQRTPIDALSYAQPRLAWPNMASARKASESMPYSGFGTTHSIAAGISQGREVLAAQHAEGGFVGQIASYEAAQASIRTAAATDKVINVDTFAAWRTLATNYLLIRIADPSKITQQARDHIFIDAIGFLSALEAETRYQDAEGSDGSSTNPYTGTRRNIWGNIDREVLPFAKVLAERVRTSDWDGADEAYRVMNEGYDKWLTKQLTAAGRSSEAAQLSGISHMFASMATVHKKYSENGHSSTPWQRVPAVLQPRDYYTAATGFAQQLPLDLYYFRDGDVWFLYDMTNPEDPHFWELPDASGATVPPVELFQKLADHDRFPEGYIQIHLDDRPGADNFTVNVPGGLTIKQFLDYASKALGIVALVASMVATGGADAPVAALEIIAIASSFASVASTAYNLYDDSQHGTVTTGTIVLSILDIVSSLAGGLKDLGKLGKITNSAALKGLREGESVYLAIHVTEAVTDATIYIVTAKENMEEIAALLGEANTADRNIAIARLVATLLGNGYMTGMKLRGAVKDLFGAGRNIELVHTGDQKEIHLRSGEIDQPLRLRQQEPERTIVGGKRARKRAARDAGVTPQHDPETGMEIVPPHEHHVDREALKRMLPQETADRLIATVDPNELRRVKRMLEEHPELRKQVASESAGEWTQALTVSHTRAEAQRLVDEGITSSPDWPEIKSVYTGTKWAAQRRIAEERRTEAAAGNTGPGGKRAGTSRAPKEQEDLEASDEGFAAVQRMREAETEDAGVGNRYSVEELEANETVKKPADMDEVDAAIWETYESYYRRRRAIHINGGHAAATEDLPLRWEQYLTRRKSVFRGNTFQPKFLTYLRGQAADPGSSDFLQHLQGRRLAVESNVGVAGKGKSTTTKYVDQFIVDLDTIGPGKVPYTASVSDKSRKFGPTKKGGEPLTREQLLETFNTDKNELRGKYGEQVTLLRKQGVLKPLRGKSVPVSEMYLVYDRKAIDPSALDLVEELVREANRRSDITIILH